MNRVLVLEGSPRKGNTSVVTDWVLAGMGKGNKVTRVKLCELHIAPCQECFTCKLWFLLFVKRHLVLISIVQLGSDWEGVLFCRRFFPL